MLNNPGKVLERMIHGRFEAAVELNLAENQYGFEKG